MPEFTQFGSKLCLLQITIFCGINYHTQMGVVYGSQGQNFSPEIMRFHLQHLHHLQHLSHCDGHVHQPHLNLQQY